MLVVTYSKWLHRLQNAHLRRTKHLVNQCFSLESVAWLHFRNVGDVQVLTRLAVIAQEPAETQVKIIWAPLDVELYHKYVDNLPLPAYVAQMSDIETTRVSGDRYARF
ncbi:hypothetical protein H0H92_002820 [Tricholoma furcatifolium]|nr:hypothetical protein H0H92_002820 [Tricholoma furcatifolium]